jgi:hypothetical protein
MKLILCALFTSSVFFVQHLLADDTSVPLSPIAQQADTFAVQDSMVETKKQEPCINISDLPDGCRQTTANGTLTVTEPPVEDDFGTRYKELTTLIETIKTCCAQKINTNDSYQLTYSYDTTKDIPVLSCAIPTSETPKLPGTTRSLIVLDTTRPGSQKVEYTPYIESEDHWHIEPSITEEEQSILEDFGQQLTIEEQENGDVQAIYNPSSLF